jgi:hypothetical protein
MPEITDPSTCPQIPETSFSGWSPGGETTMSHVLVPITLSIWLGPMPPPTAPM